ncbi:phosphatidate cytidylyltransferase [Cocleimonas sp. KMM 6892]|uniref:phosphatidate cytidylyltransferase n=1 Tax=unclassified Cocleimonas TaxID=2639732 RepID=UPI002DB804E5|nr:MULTISPECIES: phosphatidate cytidylyltransferase [unclassified Cocleimonas]MEB8431021.1 phosphatidate cytidylyltransferase [Cocleimonas sp. KMM 6892]MEC4714207.1 phosphatidate cytidylyltransferase [Cocleimonas sp. KMM 6895]MEC4743538.1 phosphatidate cytidylyltransferase [Cocleimonas sp. KMM 6896]
MDSVLKQRLITAFVLIAAVFVCVLLLPNVWFAVVGLLVFVSISGWEWSRLVSLENFHRGLYVAWLLLLSYLLYRWSDFRWLAMVLGLVWWAFVLVLLAIYEQGTTLYKENKWLLRVAAFFVLIPAWVALISLHQLHPSLVIYLIALVAMADSGAYFAGKAFGKNKLAPELSPGKTREGMLGGLLGASTLSIFGAWYFELPVQDWVYFILLSMVVAVMSVAGDLFESLMKREVGQKDSGNILPGHGGILDRVDGLLAALPIFAMGIFWGAIQV